MKKEVNLNKKSQFTFIFGKKKSSELTKLFLEQKMIPESSIKVILKKFFKNKMGLIGCIMLFTIIMLAIIMPMVYTDYSSVDTTIKNKPLSSQHLFGTDQYGRDIFARLWYGLRFSITLAVMATLIDLVVGVTLGIWMGYSKKADAVIMFIIKIMSNIPSIILLILLVVVINPSFWVIVFALTFTGWTGMSVQIRAQVLRLNSKDWVVASKVLGAPERTIIASFVPVILPIIITQLVFTIPGVILAEASLGFIGLSLPNEPTLGNLIAESRATFTVYPSQMLIPSMFLVTIVISVQLIGNAIQEVLKSSR